MAMKVRRLSHLQSGPSAKKHKKNDMKSYVDSNSKPPKPQAQHIVMSNAVHVFISSKCEGWEPQLILLYYIM